MKYVVANWKAYVTDSETAKELADAVSRTKKRRDVAVVLCPPFLFVPALAGKRTSYALGAQDVFWKTSGPYTGEITADMLKKLGVTHVIVGHSERRHHLGETDDIVHQKLEAVLSLGLKAVLCVGEKERQDPRAIPALVGEQVKKAFNGIAKQDAERVIVAYEPVWAIGTGMPDTPDDALSAALYIRKILADIYDTRTAGKVAVLYGGSVDVANVADFVSQDGVDGVLVGKASTIKKSFVDILKRLA